MSPLKTITPVIVFVSFLVGTMILRKSDAHQISKTAAVQAEKPLGPRTRTVRPEDVQAEVRALLRAGNMEAAREKLRELGKHDAVAFFKILRRLPGLPGMDDIVKEVAARLTWNDPATFEFLNNIGPDEWKILAWQGYINGQIGMRPDQEVYDVGLKAAANAFGSSLSGLLADAAEKRPAAMLAIISKESDMVINMMFFENVMKFHPERSSELFQSIPDGSPGSSYNKGYVLSTMVEALPTAENLEKALRERGSRGIYEEGSGSFLVCSALSKADTRQRAGILEWIGTQPPIARSRLLEGFVFSTMFDYSDPIAPAEFAKVLSNYTSGTLQEKALESWLKRNKDIDEKDPDWMNQLPTERLRNHARELKAGQEEKNGGR